MPLQYRRKLQCLMTSKGVRSWWCIQVREQGTRAWSFLVSDDGLVKHATAADCDAHIESLQATSQPAPF